MSSLYIYIHKCIYIYICSNSPAWQFHPGTTGNAKLGALSTDLYIYIYICAFANITNLCVARCIVCRDVKYSLHCIPATCICLYI